ncbi:DUF7504 family protein [Halomontanus rarus]|uniref:DUF7504 family protein n=1 Tax=Halomontanus rarus TaxID=3034020 RepID=UPI003CE56EDF
MSGSRVCPVSSRPYTLRSATDSHVLVPPVTVTVDVDGVSHTTVGPLRSHPDGEQVNTSLTRWRDDPLSTLWFDSITALLRTADLETTFRLCHVLTTKVRRTDAIAYYRLAKREGAKPPSSRSERANVSVRVGRGYSTRTALNQLYTKQLTNHNH